MAGMAVKVFYSERAGDSWPVDQSAILLLKVRLFIFSYETCYHGVIHRKCTAHRSHLLSALQPHHFFCLTRHGTYGLEHRIRTVTVHFPEIERFHPSNTPSLQAPLQAWRSSFTLLILPRTFCESHCRD